MTLNLRTIFLLDGIGALLSAIFLGIILPMLQAHIGIPIYTLWLLAIIALFFAIYSLSCFWFLDTKNTKFLKAIITANLAYCILTALLVGFHIETITTWGIAYFLLEILIILGLVTYELRVLSFSHHGASNSEAPKSP